MKLHLLSITLLSVFVTTSWVSAFDDTPKSEAAAEQKKEATKSSKPKAAQPEKEARKTDEKQQEEKSEKPTPPTPPKAESDDGLKAEVAGLKKTIEELRAAYDKFRADRTKEREEWQKASAAVDKKLEAVALLLKEIKKNDAEIAKLREAQTATDEALAKIKGDGRTNEEQIAELERTSTATDKKLTSLVKDTASLLNALGEISEQDGDRRFPKILGTLQVNKKLRDELIKELDVKAEAVFYNNESKPAPMWVNGTLFRLQPGKNSVRVPYGPVTLLRYTNRSPKVFTQWKATDGGFVMEFDVGKREKKAEKEEAKKD